MSMDLFLSSHSAGAGATDGPAVDACSVKRCAQPRPLVSLHRACPLGLRAHRWQGPQRVLAHAVALLISGGRHKVRAGLHLPAGCVYRASVCRDVRPSLVQTLLGTTAVQQANTRMWQRRVEQQICIPLMSAFRWGKAKVFGRITSRFVRFRCRQLCPWC